VSRDVLARRVAIQRSAASRALAFVGQSGLWASSSGDPSSPARCGCSDPAQTQKRSSYLPAGAGFGSTRALALSVSILAKPQLADRPSPGAGGVAKGQVRQVEARVAVPETALRGSLLVAWGMSV
jgi:hypothetical protein